MTVDLLEAGIIAASEAAGRVLLPEGVELRKLTVSSAEPAGAEVKVSFEALLEAKCVGSCPHIPLDARGLGLEVRASSGRADGTVEVPASITVYVPRGLARSRHTLVKLLAAVVRRVVRDIAYMLAPGRPRIRRGEMVCVDPGEGLIKVMDLLVETYGIEEGLRRFDEYLEKPGYLQVGNVEVYPREYDVCFRIRS